MIGVGGRYADGSVEVRQRVVLGVGLGLLDPSLDLAHGLQVLADPGAIRRAKLFLQAGDLLGDRVEEAGSLPQRRPAVGRAPAFAEETLENDPRVGLGGERRGRRRPREVVL